MLGPNFYGVPFALRSDGEVITTYKNLCNWIRYPLPRAKPDAAVHVVPAPPVAPPSPPPAADVQQGQQATELQQGQRVIITELQHHHGRQSKATCYKPLALLMVSPSLQSIQVLL
jgi:hypothetical protein